MPAGQSPKNLEPNKTLEWQWFNKDSLPKELFLPIKNLLAGQAYGVILKRESLEEIF